ncbi:hypothetical protein [Desulfohalovibrio reitneri]|uniref:hypothetical protein n=1 Tax=Desulfohalovibrio reitneri TaxID=1307759 RepID=UPI0004A78262|nr:hypothetical protein [Desulfohalovibrio reitneri]
MAHEIKLAKLINGDTVVGKWDEEGQKLIEVAALQTVPSQQGVQMMMLPFGYPFETEIGGEIKGEHVIYFYRNFPEEVKSKYTEAASNLTLAGAGDLDNLQGMGGGMGGGGGGGSISDLLKK